MKNKVTMYVLSGVILLALISASILLYIDSSSNTEFTVVTAPAKADVVSPIKIEEAKENFAKVELGTNLALKKKLTANNFTQAYAGKNANDGNVNTYWEGAANTYPNTLVVDLESPADIRNIRVRVNPSNMWERRKQTFSISTSQDDQTYTAVAASADYVFDPVSGNAVIIKLEGVNARYLKLEFTGNTAATGGQVAELEIY